MHGLYNILADHYSEIFSLTGNRINFITSYSLPEDAKILDIGCAVGDLAVALAKMNYSLTGIDLNGKMILHAKKNAKEKNVHITFHTMDMLEIDTLDNGPFNLILCLGNTLPHLSSYNDIRIFFSKVFSLLTSPGLFIIQILNYNKIMTDKKITFPVKEIKKYIFKRHYTFRDDGKLDFHITLHNKLTHEELTDSTCLLPLLKTRLIRNLKQTGFNQIDVFSDYYRTPAKTDKTSSIYAVRK